MLPLILLAQTTPLRVVVSAESRAKAGEQITYNVKVTNITPSALPSVNVTAQIPVGSVYVVGSASAPATLTGNTLNFAPISLALLGSRDLSFKVMVISTQSTNFTFFDNVEGGDGNWFADNALVPVGNVPELPGWEIVSTRAYSGANSWFMPDPDQFASTTLQLSTAYNATANTKFSFRHFFDMEAGFDGGVIEISTDELQWEDLGEFITKNPYNSFIPLTSPILGVPVPTASLLGSDVFCYSGRSNRFVLTEVDLGSFAGQAVFIRYRFGADVGTGADGWYIDDIGYYEGNPVFVTGIVSAQSGTTPSTSDTVQTYVVSGTSSVNSKINKNISISTYPNPSNGIFTLSINEPMRSEYTVEVTNVFGQTIKSMNVAQGNTKLELQDLPKGVYQLLVKSKSGINSHKIVIQ